MVDYSHLYDLVVRLNIAYSKNIFTDNQTKLKDYLLLSTDIIDQVALNLYALENFNDLSGELDNVYNYLSTDDWSVMKEPKDTFDIGSVFGSRSMLRMDKAIELYNRGNIRRIMISSKSPVYINTALSEAETLATYAQEQGVQSKDIIIETLSLSIPDNIKSGLDLMESKNITC